MGRHYSTNEFFRQMPNALLARYFHERGLFEDLDFSAMKETKPAPLFTAWLALPDAQRNAMDTAFQDIFRMSDEKGWVAIRDEAQWQLRGSKETLDGFIQVMSGLPNHYHRAMTTYLDHPNFWKGALRFHHADMLSHWRKRKNLGHRPAAVDDASIRQLADAIRTYFHFKEGRGHNCVVEPFRRGELDYFFAYPEDYSKQEMEWVNGQFDQRPHNPAFEVVFVYSQKDGTLDLNYRGERKVVEALQGIFAFTILKWEELPADPKDSRIYDLSPLRSSDFRFTYAVGSGIEKVVVRKLRLESRVNGGDRITLEADVEQDPANIYALMEQVGQSVPLHLFDVTQVELVASVVVDPQKPAKNIPIRLTWPNSCSLKYDERDLLLRAMLEASGIEPKDLTEAVHA
jgi:hypothetical protein